MFDLAAVQQTIREFEMDGWLLYDFSWHQYSGDADR